MEYNFRDDLKCGDAFRVKDLLKKTTVFEPFEIEWAFDMVNDVYWNKPETDYKFIFIEDRDGELAGFSCYGPIMKERPGRWDLYWIAVDPHHQQKGLGKKLLSDTVYAAKKRGAEHMYIETGSFNKAGIKLYASSGFSLMGVIREYYGEDLHKHIYGKKL